MSKTIPIVIAIASFALAGLAILPIAVSASPGFSPTGTPGPLYQQGSHGCSGNLGAGAHTECGPYYVIELDPYLSSTNPSGYPLSVGYCVGTYSSCTAHVKTTYAGQFGSIFTAGTNTQVYSLYVNAQSIQISFTATDYYTQQ